MILNQNFALISMSLTALLAFSATSAVPAHAEESIPLVIKAKVQGDRWARDYTESDFVGHERQMGKALESFSIATADSIQGLEIQYSARLSNAGDTGWERRGGSLGGTNQTVNGLAIRLSGSAAVDYDVNYSCRVAGETVERQTKNGDFCGSRDGSKNLEGFRISIVARKNATPKLEFIGRVVADKDEYEYNDGEYVGGTRQGQYLKYFSADFWRGAPGVTLEYMTHVSQVGDEAWVSAGQTAGGDLKEERQWLEGVAFRLSGPNANRYDIKYSCRVEGYPQPMTAQNGDLCGTRGQGRGLYGFQVAIIPRVAPQEEVGGIPVKIQGKLKDDNTTLTAQQGQFLGSRDFRGFPLEAFSIAIADTTVPGLGIEYMAVVGQLGDYPAGHWAKPGEIIGGAPSAPQQYVQGIAIRLTGPTSRAFDVVYSCRLVGRDDEEAEVKNGALCGTRGEGRGLEGFRVKIVRNSPQVSLPIQGAYSTQSINIAGFQHAGDFIGNEKTRGDLLKSFSYSLQNADPRVIGIQTKVVVAGIGEYPQNAWVGDGLSAQGPNPDDQTQYLQGVRFQLVGTSASQYDVVYSCRMEGEDTERVAKNGALCGTTTEPKGLEGLRIQVFRKY